MGGLFDETDSQARALAKNGRVIERQSEDRIDDFTSALTNLDVDLNHEECDESEGSSARIKNFRKHATKGLADILAEAGKADAEAKAKELG